MPHAQQTSGDHTASYQYASQRCAEFSCPIT
jgi:hypothetical protein